MEAPAVGADRLFAGLEPIQPSTRFQAEVRTLTRAVQKINEASIAGPNRELTIIVDHKSQRTAVRIIDRETGEVLRQIPQEHALRMAEEARSARRERE
jgi:uncharacterized FlaG/YvyC family protein